MARKKEEEIYDKIIFLDIDGVVNDAEYFEWLKEEYKRLDGKWPEDNSMVNEKKLNIFAELCENNEGLFICLSSSWRDFSYANTIYRLKQYKDWQRILPFIVGSTPIQCYSSRIDKFRGFRGDEIKEWLTKPGRSVGKYCIVDDDLDFLEEQEPFIVHTDTDAGITEKEVEQIKKILDLK